MRHIPHHHPSVPPTLESLEPRTLLSWTYFSETNVGPTPTRGPTAQSVFADFDGDTIPDRATADGTTLAFAKGNADGTFGTERITDILARVGNIAAGRFDGSGRSSIVGIGTRGSNINGNRPNPGFRLRAFAFDQAATATSGDTTPGAFVLTVRMDVDDFNQRSLLPTPIVGDFYSGWRDEFVIQMYRPDNTVALTVFSFKNATTITRIGDVFTPTSRISNLTTGDVLSTGKQQIVLTQNTDTSSEIIAISFSNPHTWTTTSIRTFPTRYVSLALADMDGDHHTDIVVLPTRLAQNSPFGVASARLWLIRSLGTGDFATPRALSARIPAGQWAQYSYDESIFLDGLPTIAGVADLNGDLLPDILLSTGEITYEDRQNTYSVSLPTAALQSPRGSYTISPIQFQFFGDSRFVTVADPQNRPSILVQGSRLLRPTTDPLPPRIFASRADSLALPTNVARFTSFAYDPDTLRGGSIARVDFYVDVNGDGTLDSGDITIGASTTRNSRGRFFLDATIQSNWQTSPQYSRIIAIATDSSGMTSAPNAFNLYLG